MIIINVIVASLIFWLFWIAISRLIPHTKHKHFWVVDALIKLAFVIFIVIDAAFNITYGSLIFLELPKEWMLTMRLQRILTSYDTGWRFKLALFVCRYMVEPWDFNHCRLLNNSKITEK